MNKRAVATALTAAAVLLTCGCANNKKSNKKKTVPERPTEWSVEQRSVEEVTPLKGEDMAFVKRDEDDDSIVRIIQGVLGASPVTNEQEALDLIASYSQEMGFGDVYSELKFAGTIEYGDITDYRFEQYYDGLQVTGSFIELTVDESYRSLPVVINSTYTDMWGFSTKPRVSAEAALKCASDKYKVTKGTIPKLTIYTGPTLVWIVPVSNSKISDVYIDASNGNTIHEDMKVS
ncbi:MAG: hypothetical protein J6U00_01305 [Ruminococcus sp.]|jgi:Zn-dependent metalloprotease|uniref:PepSY domain-containing protein n=1 Tax=Ruminococcus sp. TaxID=41978 RepID=UPI001B2A10DA|nr:PepSY domain-containing protein [Ruminococcus sp.]MBO7472636.1 hypothetical protein [Ruminococcus sp.]